MPDVQNHLIELLPPSDRQRLLARCEPVQLLPGQVLCEPGDPVRHAYFPVGGFVSLLVRVPGHPSLEVGMAGREGMLGAAMALGIDTVPLRALVQGAGSAWRLPAQALRGALADSGELRRHLLRYVFVLMDQMASSSACLRFHLIEPRLARWLLMSADRAHADRFHVTHEFLAAMLGVRRVGITVAASGLQRRGLIAYHRGEVTLVDRPGLTRAACSCYEHQRLAYRSVLG